MKDDPLASRLAQRLRWPIALVGLAAALGAAADLLSMVPDWLTVYAAAIVGFAAAGMFLCAVFDVKLQRAVSAMNASRRAEARRRGWLSRLTGFGLPTGDPLLGLVGLALLIVTNVAGDIYHRAAAAGLGFAGFFLVGAAAIAVMARGYPTDHLVSPFT
ncbi:MAG TPA: hypothetical protein VKQ70_09505, partial [Caulobacteraceae bacterium]|jgi:hypothetical protein|nr:hypothetical protein [Caulobacteraceae bacterium]